MVDTGINERRERRTPNLEKNEASRKKKKHATEKTNQLVFQDSSPSSCCKEEQAETSQNNTQFPYDTALLNVQTMPRVSDKAIRAEQRAVSNERHSSRSTRTSASENKSSRRRSLSAGLDPSTRKTRSAQPQHALVTPQRYAKPKVSRATLNDYASTAAMEEQAEKERLAAQERAMASFEYHSDDDSQAQISVLDVNTDDEASFDHNLIIEKIRKPRKARRPSKTTTTTVEQSTNSVNLSSLPTVPVSPDRHKQNTKKSSSSSVATLPNPDTSDARSLARVKTTRTNSLTRLTKLSNVHDTAATDDASPKQRKKNTSSVSLAGEASTMAVAASPKTRKVKKIKAKSAEEAAEKALFKTSSLRSTMSEQAATNTANILMTPEGTIKPKVKRTKSPSSRRKGTLTPRAISKRRPTSLTPHSERVSRTTVSAAVTPKSASARSGRTTGGEILPTISLHDDDPEIEEAEQQGSPTAKTVKTKKIVVVRRKKKSTSEIEDGANVTVEETQKTPTRGVNRLHSTDDTIIAVAPSVQEPHPAERVWSYFGNSPDVKNSLEGNSTHTSAIYQAAVAPAPDPPTLSGTLSKQTARDKAPSDISTVKEAPSVDQKTEQGEESEKSRSEDSQKKMNLKAKIASLSPSQHSKQKRPPRRPSTKSSSNHSSQTTTSLPPPSPSKNHADQPLSPTRPAVTRGISVSGSLKKSDRPADGRATELSFEGPQTEEPETHSDPGKDNILPTCESQMQALALHRTPKQSQIESPVNVRDRLKTFDKNKTKPSSPSSAPSSPRGRPTSPPGFVASRMKAFSSPTFPSPSQQQRRLQVQSLDTNRFSLQQQKRDQGAPKSPMSLPKGSQRSLSVDRSPITPRKIIEAFERIPDSKKSALSMPSDEITPPKMAFQPLDTASRSPPAAMVAEQSEASRQVGKASRSRFVEKKPSSRKPDPEGSSSDDSTEPIVDKSSHRRANGIPDPQAAGPVKGLPRESDSDVMLSLSSSDVRGASLDPESALQAGDGNTMDESDSLPVGLLDDSQDTTALKDPSHLDHSEILKSTEKIALVSTPEPTSNEHDFDEDSDILAAEQLVKEERLELENKEEKSDNLPSSGGISSDPCHSPNQPVTLGSTETGKVQVQVRTTKMGHAETSEQEDAIAILGKNFPRPAQKDGVLDNDKEDFAINSLPEEVVQIKHGEELDEDITVESLTDPTLEKLRKAKQQPSRVAMSRTNSGISQMTEPDFITDEERKVERRLKNAMNELNAIQKLFEDKQTEVENLRKRKETLRQERFRRMEEHHEHDRSSHSEEEVLEKTSNPVGGSSYVSSTGDRASAMVSVSLSLSNDTSKAIAELKSLDAGTETDGDTADEESVKNKLKRLHDLYDQLESKEKEIKQLNSRSQEKDADEYSNDKKSYETGPHVSNETSEPSENTDKNF